jgi:UDP-2,3-diacylglucosamine pyrophosphatase LpxH
VRRIVVSDLHLAARSESEGRARAFASFVDTARVEDPGAGLLLLGDIFDLPMFAAGASPAAAVDRWTRAAREELLRIRERHPAPFDALRRYGESGAPITVLMGNHDLALAQGPLREALATLIGPHELQPWIAYVPGVLYAEHGQQYHDITALDTLLEPDPRWARAGAPMAWAIDAVAHPLEDPGRLSAFVELVGGPLRTSLGAGAIARGRARYRDRVIPAASAGIGLPVELLQAIDRLSSRSLLGTVVRVARGISARARPARVPRDRFSGDFLAAARAIDALLAGRGLEVPLYVFGHSHSPMLAGFGPGPARYANPGAWARFRPAALRSVLGEDRYPFLRIDVAPEVVAKLVLWSAAEGREEPYPSSAGSVMLP